MRWVMSIMSVNVQTPASTKNVEQIDRADERHSREIIHNVDEIEDNPGHEWIKSIAR